MTAADLIKMRDSALADLAEIRKSAEYERDHVGAPGCHVRVLAMALLRMLDERDKLIEKALQTYAAAPEKCQQCGEHELEPVLGRACRRCHHSYAGTLDY